MTRMLLFCLMLSGISAHADVAGCSCVPGDPDLARNRACSLTIESLKQPADVKFFVIKDISPRKPNRWLVVPAGAGPASMFIEKMTPAQRLAYWTTAVERAREKFGDEWGLAYNASRVRTQCQFHLHMGRFIRASETKKYLLIKSLSEIPVREGAGLWLHPVPGGYHVHLGEETTETALVR